jgi:hypothetical protein
MHVYTTAFAKGRPSREAVGAALPAVFPFEWGKVPVPDRLRQSHVIPDAAYVSALSSRGSDASVAGMPSSPVVVGDASSTASLDGVKSGGAVMPPATAVSGADDVASEIAALMPLLEPLEPSLRNLLYTQTAAVADMLCYTPLPALLSDAARARFRRRVLIEVGANMWTGGPVALLSLYEAIDFAPHEAYFVEPGGERFDEPWPGWMEQLQQRHANTSIKAIRDTWTVVASGDPKTDVLAWIRRDFSKDDFVSLTYDLDVANTAHTIEWGFLQQFLDEGMHEWVDELFVEMHFLYPQLNPSFEVRPLFGCPCVRRGTDCGSLCHLQVTYLHSMYEAFDLLRQMRELGVVVHAWP